MNNKRHVFFRRKFLDECANEDVDAGSQPPIGDRQETKRFCRHASKLSRGSTGTKNFSIDGCRYNTNLASFDTGGGEGFGMKCAGQPNFVERVAALGPPVGNSVGSERGAAHAAPAIEVEIPACGEAGLIEHTFGEIETIVEQILQMSAENLQAGTVWLQLLSTKRRDLNRELVLRQTKCERPVLCCTLGFAFEICVNDNAGGAIA